MKSMKKFLISAVLSLALIGCSQDGGRDGRLSKSDVGTVIGGAAGAIAGAQLGKGRGQLVGVAAGTLLGAALGNSIGASMDKVDMMYHDRTAQQALETAKSGTTVTWQNPDTGHSGAVTPINVSQQADGSYCREYRQTVQVGGQSEEAFGTACRQPDGSWKIIN
jgi:surface antigen